MKNTKFIFEIGSNHNQSLVRLKELIDEAYKLGAYAIKLQLFKSDSLYKDEKNKDILQERELDITWMPIIYNYCHGLGLKLGVSVFYKECIELIKEYVDFYKISAFDILRLDLIELCLKQNKPVYISTGLAKNEDIKKIIDLYNSLETNNEIYLFHCVSKYPTELKDSSINRINEIDDIIFENFFKYLQFKDSKFELREEYDPSVFSKVLNNLKMIKLGYSDHTVSKEAIGQSIFRGAELIEFHFDLDDLKGRESNCGHVWTPTKCKELFNYLDLLEVINDSEFNISEDDLNLRADPIDGKRW